MDENSGMGFSEYVAILSGNTELLEKAKLEKKVTALESERKAFYRSQSSSGYKLNEMRHAINHNISIITEMTADWNFFHERVKKDNEGNIHNLVRLSSLDTMDSEVVGTKLNEISKSVNTKGEYREIGELYGFLLLVKSELSSKDGTIFGEENFTDNRFFCAGAKRHKIHLQQWPDS